MKNSPYEWARLNEMACHKAVVERPNLLIYETMSAQRDLVGGKLVERLKAPENAALFGHYACYDDDALIRRYNRLHQIFETAVYTGDRKHVLSYGRYLARERWKEGFPVAEVTATVQLVAELIIDELSTHPELQGVEQLMHDEIMLTSQLLNDEIQDAYDELKSAGHLVGPA